MKSNMSSKILKLAVVEVLSQSGFDKTADQALNVLTDILRYYIEQLGCRMKRRHGMGVVSDQMCRILIEEIYGECEYQVPELLSFLRYQVTVKNYLSDRYNVGSEESILHILRVLPKNAQLRMVMRNGSSLREINEIEKEVVEDDVKFDEFTKEFVRSSLLEASRREVREYRFESVDLIGGEPRKGVRIGDAEFNEILDRKQKEVEFLQEPRTLVKDFGGWNSRYVFKGYE
ncbi:hypothetical protein EHEL_050580 [Encephalitozoon hellem ATCC 50504]|uniref:Histone-fold protein n=1 Tax=Encephalitozoon hellem TaxID=27973 RepID=A0A9Q9F9I0_ENCHE|nr:uncharacterized protein EHEL_050580 [Encephalitozoon hellem ATCC 50504]AFM98269.1 hypothetical protein EHEL_050580 [Encephalitozoon hellem ATCC 50504]UTX43147.1 histone-fold protein [Encephalitozoon hellem]WEL38604.1 histone-fold protein [Encephalitozoon hellem]|eukprot:XP_003887250.1 hypothetical protein EHEL_050580 [Encephalitozoon hellem ATCC 50504]